MTTNNDKEHTFLQKDKVPDKARQAFKRKPYETLANYAERRAREDRCQGCFGAANGDCGMCERDNR